MAVMASAVSARPSSLRATSATSAPASARATAMVWPIPRDAPVTNAFLPVRSKRLTLVLPFGGQGPGGGVDSPHDRVQHDTDARLPDPEAFRPVHSDDLRLRHPGEPGPRLARPQAVVALGHQPPQRAPGWRPPGRVRVARPA